MFGKTQLYPLNILMGVLGLVLIGLGVFLITHAFVLTYITLGTIIGGLLILICSCCITKCNNYLRLLCCIFLIMFSLFLINTGILSILIAGVFGLRLGLILISLGLVALILGVLCIVSRMCGCNISTETEV